MNDEAERRIAEQIGLAEELAAEGAEDAAALAFATARRMCVSLADPGLVERRVEAHTKPLIGEREHYRRMIAELRVDAPRQLVIFGDSLGLPRPDDKSGEHGGADRTYPMLVLDHLPDHGVQSYCQRYFTTDSVLELLAADPDLGAGADVLIHLGLNDCANRMFLEPERLALDELNVPTKDRIVGFAQQHRRMLLAHLPGRHYVSPEGFRRNLDTILGVLSMRGVGRVALATIILPPERFWQGTPGMQQNFTAYNSILLSVAKEHDGAVLDIDRLAWARLHEDSLLPDGMHLGPAGHQLFAEAAAAALTTP